MAPRLRRRGVVALTVALTVAGGSSLAWGLYLPAKAALGQALLRVAWERSEGDVSAHRPWPWARTWPVARLAAPRHGVDEIVLEGAGGDSLAWAPGLVAGSARPGEAGNVAIAGHRDTVFRFLGQIELGEELILGDREGGERRYRVVRRQVVDEREVSVLAPTSRPTLTLVTCFPFDALQTGGPLRYVVQAVAIAAEAQVGQE